jgi:DNA (cytosine-5)-methyltransferase 1
MRESNPRLKCLDLFCGAGGASMGLHRAGFEVTGVDLSSQKNYPFNFIQGDVTTLDLDLKDFDFIWASPPCQKFSSMTKRWGLSEKHPDLIPFTRELLIKSGKPYVIENVIQAPLIDPIILCGSMFDLPLRRHRKFESSFPISDVPRCNHVGEVIGVYGHPGGSSKRDGIKFSGTDSWRKAMGITWMTGSEMAQAIPPAYSEFIARQFLKTR